MNHQIRWQTIIAMTIALMASGCAVGYTDTYPDNGYGPDLVYAAPGTYVVVPDEPIGLSPQTPEVTVEAGGLTHLDLMFDTGIR